MNHVHVITQLAGLELAARLWDPFIHIPSLARRGEWLFQARVQSLDNELLFICRYASDPSCF